MKTPTLLILGLLSGLGSTGLLWGQSPKPSGGPGEALAPRPFQGRRAVLTHSIEIDASPDRVFPLLCPVREGEWAEGWMGRPIYSISGVSEENAVFETEHEGGIKTLWFVVNLDPKRHVNELVYWMPEGQLVRLHMRVSALGPQKSKIDVKYIRTSLSEQGNQSLQKAEAHFLEMMAEWQASLNHFVTTGRMLRAGS